jgi:hypothetical protein
MESVQRQSIPWLIWRDWLDSLSRLHRAIVYELSEADPPLDVMTIANSIFHPQPQVSKALQCLRSRSIVSMRVAGRQHLYTLVDRRWAALRADGYLGSRSR